MSTVQCEMYPILTTICPQENVICNIHDANRLTAHFELLNYLH